MIEEENSNNSASPPGPKSSGGDHPSEIGPYRILDTLGEGGMSVVYLAEQSEPVKRRVALKILKPGMDSKQVVARFESERQALAVLDHPNIAKIFDGGIAESGRPYFVMEQVKGVPITDYCDDQRLDNEERLKVFINVCSAVQHAHLKGLIHRDLKPSNILVGVVDEEPQPKIIDFGIAKATTTTLTEATLYTRVGQIIGTPQYMSPEQADLTGLDIDTRTDIYSLGVVLYELLVGTVPLDLRAIGDQAMRVAIREKEPPKPSTRFTELGDTREEVAKVRGTDPNHLRQQLMGDLDWIVMRAIEKDRTRRYETANALAMECRRFLKHEPVLARPPSPGYLLQRFVRRNRLTVVAGSVAILAIIAGAAAATFGYLRATEAEQVARQEAETSRLVSNFLEELFEVSDPYFSEQASTEITAHDLIVRGSERLENELVDRPDIQARLMNTMGGVFISLGGHERAFDLISRALEIRTSAIGSSDVELAESYYNLGRLHFEKGDYESAQAALNQALDYNTRVSGGVSLGTARTLEFLASIAGQQSRFEDSREALARAAEIRRQLPETTPEDLAFSANALGMTLYSMGDYPAARDAFEEAIENYAKGTKTGNYARTVANLAAVYQIIGDYDKAIVAHLDALALKREVFAPDHIEIGYSLNNLGQLYRQRGQYAEAEPAIREALDIFRKAVGPQHGNVAIIMVGLGHLLRDAERYEEAEAYFEEALPILETAFGDGSVHALTARNGWAYSIMLRGDSVSAESMFLALISKAEELEEEHPELGIAYSGLASINDGQLSAEQREQMFLDAIRILDEKAGPENFRSIDARIRYARFLNSSGNEETAREMYAAALVTLEKRFGRDDPNYIRSLEQFERDFD